MNAFGRRLRAAALAALALAAGACSSDDETGPQSELSGVYEGIAHFGFAGTPQPIRIVIDGTGSTFGGTVATDHVPDGAILDGTWDGTNARWRTSEGGVTAQWEATLSGTTLSGDVVGLELTFSASRV